MIILHTEASTGWGGQEIRILREAIGMRERGHTIVFAVGQGAKLSQKALEQGFSVVEFPLGKSRIALSLGVLIRCIRKHHVDVINTHSSWDAWVGGLAGKLCRVPVVRTRHLSTKIREGLNSRLLYAHLARQVVTTCEQAAALIRRQARLGFDRCRSIPTGVDPNSIQVDMKKAEGFHTMFGLDPNTCLVGTVCVLRSWKGISTLLQAAHRLRDHKHIKWVIVGSGPSEERFRSEWQDLNLEGIVHFTGHLQNPFSAMQAMDIFALLSTANEGVSQASLQAAYLGKPLIHTPTGGLPEVCIDQKTGFLVDNDSPEQVAKSVLDLASNREKREAMGNAAKALVSEKFTFDKTLNGMEKVFSNCLSC